MQLLNDRFARVVEKRRGLGRRDEMQDRRLEAFDEDVEDRGNILEDGIDIYILLARGKAAMYATRLTDWQAIVSLLPSLAATDPRP